MENTINAQYQKDIFNLEREIKEMKETTKREMDKLAQILKNRTINIDNKIFEDDFIQRTKKN